MALIAALVIALVIALVTALKPVLMTATKLLGFSVRMHDWQPAATS